VIRAVALGGGRWRPQRTTTPDQGAARPEEASRPETAALTSGSGGAPTQADALQQLAKLGELRDSGVISEAEFEAKKAELLRRI
jgi:Short C-terminal domain